MRQLSWRCFGLADMLLVTARFREGVTSAPVFASRQRRVAFAPAMRRSSLVVATRRGAPSPCTLPVPRCERARGPAKMLD